MIRVSGKSSLLPIREQITALYNMAGRRAAIPRSVYTPAYQAFLVLLRQKRADAGLSQRVLARRLNKPPSYVHKCEVGDRQLNLIELRLWCHALHIDWLEFGQELESTLEPLPPVPLDE